MFTIVGCGGGGEVPSSTSVERSIVQDMAEDESVKGGMALQDLRGYGAAVLLAEADLANQEEEDAANLKP